MDETPWSPDWKKEELVKVFDLWEGCTKCPLHKERLNQVFGEGSADASILVVGGMHSELDNEEGVPFAGSDGVLLREFLDGAGIATEDVFITNTVLCMPPDKRDPNSKEKAACSERLNRIIYVLDPILIIAVGKVAFKHFAKAAVKGLRDQHGMLFPCSIQGKHFPIIYDVMPIWSPKYILANDKRYTSGPKKDQWREGGFANDVFTDLDRIREYTQELLVLYKMIKTKSNRELK